MEQTVFYNVFHHPPMGALTAAYFFFLGLGSGSLLTAVSLRLFGGGRYERPEKFAAILAPIATIIGGLFLFAELGRPLRAWHLLAYFNPHSVASWGVWIVNLLILCSILYAAMLVLGKGAAAKRFGIVALVLGTAAALYSGVLLYQMRARPLWHSATIPPLFLVSALASGFAVTILFSVLARVDRDRIRGLARAFTYILGIDLLLVLLEVIVLLLGGGEKLEVLGTILSGWYGLLFVGVYIILGLVVPLLLLARSNVGRVATMAAPLLVLAGTLAMRYVIVMGGQALPLS